MASPDIIVVVIAAFGMRRRLAVGAAQPLGETSSMKAATASAPSRSRYQVKTVERRQFQPG